MKPIKKGWRIWPPVVIIKYWTIQGILYMNWTERLHRWALEIVFFLCAYVGFTQFVPFPHILIVSLITAHTISIILNGHLFAMCAHDLYWFSLYRDRKRFFRYVENLRERLNRRAPEYTCGVVFFGSLSRGIFQDSSDLDVRFISEDGFLNALRTAHLTFLERLHALLSGFPMDAYMFRNGAEIGKKMDVENEVPVYLYKHGQKLKKILPQSKSFETFKDSFCKQTDE